MRKLKILQITIVVLLIIFVFFLFRAVDYTKEYNINGIKIAESYDKKDKFYYFTFTYKNTTFDYLIENKYLQKRNFIKDVKIIENEKDYCVIPESDTFDFIPLCLENDQITYYTNISDNLLKLIPENYILKANEAKKDYHDMIIYNEDYTYLLWNYKGFDFVNEQVNKEVNFLENEKYNINLVGYTNDYLIVANYDEEYTFKKIYRISLKDGTIKEFDLKFPIYFDSYFPGFINNKLYIVDNNEEVMYELNADNGKLEKIKAKILNYNEWENVNIKTLINQDKKFTYKSNYVYELKDDMLTLNYKDKKIKTKIDNGITSIIRIKEKTIFYLKNDTVYAFEPTKGITRLIYNFEWNFNYENMIYIN